MDETERLLLPLTDGEITLPEGPVLLLNASPSPALSALPRAMIRAEQGMRPAHDALARAGIATAPRQDAPAAAALVLIPRSREEALGLIARAFRLSAGPVLIAGAKVDGIDGILTRLRALVPSAGTRPKAHGKVAWFERPATLPPDFAAWEAAAEPQRNAEGFLTAPGMFSHAHADPGSRLLAEALAGRITGRIADLGAGYGWLAASLLASCPGIAKIDLFEAQHAALEAAKANVTDPRAAFHWADVPALTRAAGPYDAIVTNPPFHAGRAAEPDLGIAFLTAAQRLLTPGGRLFVVANRQLPYEAALERLFVQSSAETVTGGYKILTAHRPKRR